VSTGRRGIERNSARCRLCAQEIESNRRHPRVRCDCGALTVDGVRAALVRSYDPERGTLEDICEDTSICRHDPSPYDLAVCGWCLQPMPTITSDLL
jgi:hypothetical protein